MPQQVSNTLKINLPVEQVWAVINDYASLENYALTIKSSPIVGELATGLGAKRKCTFNDGSSVVEEIVEYSAGEGYTMVLSEHSMPLKSMSTEMKVVAIDAESCQVSMSTEFVVKGGIFGWLMGAVLMKPMMKGVFNKLMTGLAYYCKTGKPVGEALPPKEQLAELVG